MNDKTTHDTKKSEEPVREEKTCSREKRSHRIALLLRMWCVDETGRSNWQASLEEPETGKRIGFASLEQLFIYLIDMSENRNNDQDKENLLTE